MAGISDSVAARRQKDLNGFTEGYQRRLDRMVGKHMDDLAPAWQRMTKNLSQRVKFLYSEMGATNDPRKIMALKNKAERLEALASQLADDLKRMESKLQPFYTGAIKNIFEDSYYIQSFALEQAARVAVTVPVLTQSQVLGVIANPWLPDGANYSSRLRANTAFLADKMRGAVAQAVANGWGIQEAARSIEAIAGEGYHNAVRLLRTEMNRAASLASSYSFMQNADILDGKRWNATLDAKTAPKDAENDGEIYPLDYDTPENEGVPGQRIPNHPNCRCKWTPVLSATGVSERERIARDQDGNRIYTQARTYEEYAKERGLPSLKDRLAKDNPAQYLRPGESLADLNKKVVYWQAPGGTVAVPKPIWEQTAPRFSGGPGSRRQFLRQGTEANPVPAATAPVMPTFTNYKDAEKWAAANLKTPIGSMKGVQVNHLNDTLREIQKIENTLKDGIPARIEFGNVVRGAHAHYSPSTGTIHLKKLDKDINKSMLEANERAIKRGATPFHAVPTKEGTLWHEVGHAIDHKNNWKYARSVHSLPYKDRGVFYEVSAYASSDAFMPSGNGIYNAEAWAENFAAYFANNDRTALVPIQVMRWIKELIK